MDDLPLILLVDDDYRHALRVQHALSGSFRVRTLTGSGPLMEAIAAGQPRPDLILMDVVMPGMNGYSLFEWLRADGRWAGVPTIFLTGATDRRAEARALTLGAADFITKPFQPRDLIARIRATLPAQVALRVVADNVTPLRAVDADAAAIAAVADVPVALRRAL